MTGYVFDPDSFVFNYKHVDGFHLFITGYNGWHSDIEIPNLTNGNIIWGIYMNAFSNNLTLKSVKIDKRSEKTGFGPKIIMEEAFMNCRSLEKAVICDENITIERGAFAGCPKLTIYGYEGSTAEKYAFSNGINFVDIGEFEKVDIKGTFTVSKEQMSILNGVLKNIRNLCLSLGCVGSAQLFDYKGMSVLKWCDVEYALENDAVYKDNRKIVGKEADMIKSYIEKTISLIEKYIPMPVKSITFAVYDGNLREGRFARAIDEPSSLAFILR